MYEMLAAFELFDIKSSNAINSPAHAQMSVHLCEAPGAFIAATNHYMQTKKASIAWPWLANSLNPYFEGNDQGAMIDDDALIQVRFAPEPLKCCVQRSIFSFREHRS